MSNLAELITDRTEDDIKNNTVRGRYCEIDLNRVEAWVRYLTERLRANGIDITLITKENWQDIDIPMPSDMIRYLNNIDILAAAYYTLPTTPSLPATMVDLDIAGANNIEQVLFDINHLIENMESQFIYAGEVYAGELLYNDN